MKIGYARVSTKEQHLDMQLEALKAAGCEKIFSEKMTGRQQNRPELDACLSFLREGDTLVVYKLDRLGRSLKNILTLLEDFKNRGIQFTSLQDNISTEGAIGQLMNNILGAFAQFERDLIYERTQEGRRIAKEKGVNYHKRLAEICQVVKGPVSGEVISTDYAGMMNEAAERSAHGSRRPDVSLEAQGLQGPLDARHRHR